MNSYRHISFLHLGVCIFWVVHHGGEVFTTHAGGERLLRWWGRSVLAKVSFSGRELPLLCLVFDHLFNEVIGLRIALPSDLLFRHQLPAEEEASPSVAEVNSKMSVSSSAGGGDIFLSSGFGGGDSSGLSLELMHLAAPELTPSRLAQEVTPHPLELLLIPPFC